MKVAREKKVLNLQGKTDKVHSRPIHRNVAGQEGVAGEIQCGESEKYAAKNILSSKAIIQNRRRDKEFPKQKPSEFVTTKPAPEEILRGDSLEKKRNKT